MRDYLRHFWLCVFTVTLQTTSSMQVLFCPVLKILSLYPCPVQPPTTSSASTSSSICSLFLCLSISVPWFPWDWILSQIILEGSLSSIDPLGSTALCRGSEVWRMWCMWPMGKQVECFQMTSLVTAALRSAIDFVHLCKHTSLQQHVCCQEHVVCLYYLNGPFFGKCFNKSNFISPL